MPEEKRTTAAFKDNIAEVSKTYLLELMLTLKSYKEALVLIGGWVPYFLLEKFQRSGVEFQHVGSRDIDIAVDPQKVGEDQYATIVELIGKRGYQPKEGSTFSFVKEAKLASGGTDVIQIDFLGPEYGGTAKSKRHQRVQEKMLIRKARGADIVFDHNLEFDLSGKLPNGAEALVKIKVADIVGILTMKGIVIGERYSEKDAYDIYSLIAHYKDGPVIVAKEVQPYLKNPLVREGIEGIANKFRSREAEGPAWVADFEMVEEAAKEQLITDSYMQAQRFLLALYEPLEPPRKQENNLPMMGFPVLDIEPNLGSTGGSSGHFVHFRAINIGEKIAIDCRWGIRGFAYEWRSPETFVLRPGDRQKLEYKISDERPFKKLVPELNIFFEYKDNRGVSYFTRRELVLEKVPSGAFYNVKKVGEFHPAVVLQDSKIRNISEPYFLDHIKTVDVEVEVDGGTRRVEIRMSHPLRKIFEFSSEEEKAALNELAQRKVRNMLREGKLQNHLFTGEELPQKPLSGFEAYKALRDSLDR